MGNGIIKPPQNGLKRGASDALTELFGTPDDPIRDLTGRDDPFVGGLENCLVKIPTPSTQQQSPITRGNSAMQSRVGYFPGSDMSIMREYMREQGMDMPADWAEEKKKKGGKKDKGKKPADKADKSDQKDDSIRRPTIGGQDLFEKAGAATEEELLALDPTPHDSVMLMTYAKVCRWKAEGRDHNKQPDADIFWKKVFALWEAAQRKRPTPILLTDIINHAEKEGILARFPDETCSLLGTALVTSKRVEFLDGLHKFALKHGKLKEFSGFMITNLDTIVQLPIQQSEVFYSILKYLPDSDKIRYALTRHAAKTEKGVKRKEVMAQWLVTCLLQDEENIPEARKVVEKMRREFPRARELWDRIEASCDRLIPDFGFEDFDSPERKGLQSLRSPNPMQITQETRAQIHTLAVMARWNEAMTKGDTDECVYILKQTYKNPGILYHQFIRMMAECLQTFCVPGSTHYEKTMEATTRILDAENNGNLRIPAELYKLLIARYYERWETHPVEGISRGPMSLMRSEGNEAKGTVYYEAMRQLKGLRSFNEGKMHEGDESDNGRKRVLAILAPFMSKFAGTQWEAELWKTHLIEMYPVHKKDISIDYAGNKIDDIVDAYIAEHAGNVAANIAAHELRFDRAVAQKTLRTEAIDSAKVLLAKEEDVEKRNNLTRKIIELGKTSQQHDLLVKFLENHPDRKTQKWITVELCHILLHPLRLTSEKFRRAATLSEDLDELPEDLERRLAAARREVGEYMVTDLSPEELIEQSVNGKGKALKSLIPNGNTMALLLKKIFEIRPFLIDLISTQIDSLNGQETTVDLPTMHPLSFYFGCEKIILRFSKGVIQATLCGSANIEALEIPYTHITLTPGQPYHSNSTSTSEENAIRFATRLLEICILEQAAQYAQREPLNYVDEQTQISKEEMHLFNERTRAALQQLGYPDAEVNGSLEGIATANQSIANAILTRLPTNAKQRIPSGEEAIALTDHYRALIASCRDLERPVQWYNANLDPHSPFLQFIKFMKIYGVENARNQLSLLGIGEKQQKLLPITPDGKNNFVGYYELVCYFEDFEEVRIRLFLDKNGRAIIPGVPETHPLYAHLQLTVLESLALKTVPELKPYAQLFSKHKRKNRHARLKNRRPIPYSPDMQSDRKRTCCAALILARSGANPETGEKISMLDDITQAFTLVELCDKNLTQWPLFRRDRKTNAFVSSSQLFAHHAGETYVVRDELVNLGITDGEITEGTKNSEEATIQGRTAISLATLSKELLARIMSDVRVQSSPARGYRMPIKFTVPEYEIFEKDGKEYFLIPAQRKSHHNRYIERDGKLYQVKPVPQHTKVNINGTIYFAMPWQISDKQLAIYESQSTIELNFNGKKVLYAVISDNATGEILASCHIGPADKDDQGRYTDFYTRHISTLHAKERMGIFETQGKIQTALRDRTDLTETLFEVDTTDGYKQGVFPPIGNFGGSQHGTREAAIRLVMKHLSSKLGEAQAALIQAELEESFTKTGNGTSSNTPNKKPQPTHAVQEFDDSAYALRYRADMEGGRYSGLAGQSLWVMPKGTPAHATYAEALSPTDDEVLVYVGNKNGTRVAKIHRALLGKPRTK